MAEAAAVAAENNDHRICCFESFCSKPAAVAAELAARLSRQLHTAAAAD